MPGWARVTSASRLTLSAAWRAAAWIRANSPAPARRIKSPRVAEAPCALECKWLHTLTLRDLDGRPLDRHVAFGQLVGVHIDDRFIANGKINTAAMKPIARCGYDQYAVVDSVFSMTRPEVAEAAPARVAAGGRRSG